MSDTKLNLELFNQWNSLKKKINQHKKVSYFSEREIWWCSLGKNIGHEQDGKNKLFERPILILKQFNLRVFLALPLTTKLNKNKYYHRYKFRNNNFSAILSQIRLLDAKRLQRKIGTMSIVDYEAIRKKMINLI